MCFESKEAAFAAVCQERDELRKIVDKQAAMNLKAAELALELDSVKAERDEAQQALREFAKDVLYQFGYKITYKGRLHLNSGGLSPLECAFGILGWEDPKPFPEGECEWDGCHAYATCGTPTPDGYKRVCVKHFVELTRDNVLEGLAKDINVPFNDLYDEDGGEIAGESV